MKTKMNVILLVFLVAILSGCNDSYKYRKLVKQELARNVRKDTLLHDIRFGMTKRDFFSHCWQLNKKGIFKEGAANKTVFFEMETKGKKYYVNFFPIFSEGKIVELPVDYTYPAFAPWNPEYSLDLLQSEIVEYYIEKHGNDYLELKSKNPDNGSAYVWIDANRRISVYKNVMRNSVTALYFDLSSKKELDVASNGSEL